MTGYILFGITYAFAATVQPGPFQAFLFSRTVQNGWRRTFPAIFAPLISDGPIITLVLLLLSQVPDALLQALRLAGGLFLLYLAWGAYRTWRSFEEQSVAIQTSGQKTMLQAVLVNFINPNPYLGWSLVMGPLLLQSWSDAPVYSVILLGSFYGTMLLMTTGLLLLFDFARRLGQKISKISIAISAVALAVFGLYQLWQGVIYYF